MSDLFSAATAIRDDLIARAKWTDEPSLIDCSAGVWRDLNDAIAMYSPPEILKPKPLVWKVFGPNRKLEAFSSLGDLYAVNRAGGKWCVFLNGSFLTRAPEGEDQGKAIAEAHHAKRLMACFETPSQTAEKDAPHGDV